jgi:hypothetical protein
VSDSRESKNTRQDSSAVHEASSENRKAYQAPILAHWGTLRDLTRAAGVSGASDGGKVLLRKTRW